jgi:hypothetical protein
MVAGQALGGETGKPAETSGTSPENFTSFAKASGNFRRFRIARRETSDNFRNLICSKA